MLRSHRWNILSAVKFGFKIALVCFISNFLKFIHHLNWSQDAVLGFIECPSRWLGDSAACDTTMLASDNTVLPSISQSKEANHGPSGDITSISIARVKVKVMLTPTNVQYSHSVHFRAPWPTISQTSSYLPPFIKFSFPRLKTTSDVEVVDIYIGERRARWEWDGYWIKVWLVDGGGVLDVVYSVPVRDGEDKEKLDAVLPVFAVAISRLKMKVDVPTGARSERFLPFF
jgi:hypothetical protein